MIGAIAARLSARPGRPGWLDGARPARTGLLPTSLCVAAHETRSLYPKWTGTCHNRCELGWGGLSERSGFRARAGTLTLLLLAGREGPETVRAALAQLDAAMFHPDFDPEAGAWAEAGEWDEEEWEDEDGADGAWEALEDDDDDDDGRLPPVLAEHMLIPPRLRRGVDELNHGSAHELRYVARVLAAWLRESPAGPLRIREEEGLLAVGALASGWSSTVVHALSGAALTFEELEQATGAVNREALKARVLALEDASLVELLEGPAGEARYAATPWLRRGIAPLAAAARHECRLRSRESAPPDVLDVGAAFLLTLPRVELPAGLSGVCRLGVWLPHGGQRMPGARIGQAGATAHVENGHVVSVDLDLDLNPSPRSWAAGSPLDWLETVIEPRAGRVDLGGSARLGESLIVGLHELLFGDVIASGSEDLRSTR